MADHQSTYPSGGVTDADSGGAARPPNKGMKLTSVQRIGRSQLIPGVRPPEMR